MKLIDILTDINPILRILILIVLAVAAIFTVKIIRRFSQYLLTMKVDSKETSQEILTKRYPKLATIITILVSAVTFTIYNPQQKYSYHQPVSRRLHPCLRRHSIAVGDR